MFSFIKKPKKSQNQSDQEAPSPSGDRVSPLLSENAATMKRLFSDMDLLHEKQIVNSRNRNLKYCIFYCDGIVKPSLINDSILRPLTLSEASVPGEGLIDFIMKEVVQIHEMEKTTDFADIINEITYGSTILFAEGAGEALICNTKCFETRAITEPENEKVLNGSREGFNESLLNNLSLIRRRIRTTGLKMRFMTFGKRTQVAGCVCYMENIVNPKILDEFYRRMEKIDMDAVLDTNYIVEIIRDHPLSLFRTTGYTERPDVTVAKLMEGRIALLLDGTPSVLTLPYLFIENLQSNEDYYLNFYYTSFSRILRMIGFFMTITVPGLYVAVVAFHHEMLPSPLLINLAAERQSVPLPAALEAFIMLVVFDILRETGVRMPSNIGQALSIVGALVIGQAAVEARLVAAPMIIVVGFTGITSLLVPKMNAPVIYIRMFLLFSASSFGFFGLVLGLSCVFIHLLNLTSFGIPQVSMTGNLRYQDVKDTAIRAPWWQMLLRPRMMAKDRERMKQPEGNTDE